MYHYHSRLTLLCAAPSLPCRSRGPSRAASASLGVPAPAGAPDARPASPASSPQKQARPQQARAPEGPTNEQMVWEMLYNPQFSLPVAEAEAAWARAVGEPEAQDEEVRAL